MQKYGKYFISLSEWSTQVQLIYFLKNFSGALNARNTGLFQSLWPRLLQISGCGRIGVGRMCDVIEGTICVTDTAMASDSASSSGSSSELNLSCSFSSFESEVSEAEEGENDSGTIEPYRFEPLASDSSESAEQALDTESDVQALDAERLTNTDW